MVGVKVWSGLQWSWGAEGLRHEGDLMLGRLFALRSWVLDAVIGLEAATRQLVPTATSLTQTGLGCLRKSTTCAVSSPVALGKNGLEQRGWFGGQDASGQFEPGLVKLAGPSPAGRQMK